MVIDFSTLTDLDLPHEEARRFARELSERYPSLKLVRLRPGEPEFTERRPYAIIDLEPFTLHRVLKVLPETLLNGRGLAEVIDLQIRRHGGMTPDRYWALRQGEQAMKARRRAEELEERHDLLMTMLRSPKHTFRYYDAEAQDTIVIQKGGLL